MDAPTGKQPAASVKLAVSETFCGLELPRISSEIWDLKYRLKDGEGVPVDRTRADTLARVANAAAEAEPVRVGGWAFRGVLNLPVEWGHSEAREV